MPIAASHDDLHEFRLPATRHPFVRAVVHGLRDDAGAPGGARLVVGVSGGVDSVALLVALAAAARRPHLDWSLIVGHVDHGLRPDSAEDARFVEHLSRRLDVPFVGQSVAGLADEPGNRAAAARRARYDLLHGLVAERAAWGLVTAHHATDQLETVLLALLRGAGPEALAGMAPEREIRGLRVARPMLAIPRAEIETFARAHDLVWREDPSNVDPASRRARLRHEILPRLEQIAPGADRRILRMTTLLRERLVEGEEDLEPADRPADVPPGDARGPDELRRSRADLARLSPPRLGARLRRLAAGGPGAPGRDRLTWNVVRPVVEAIRDGRPAPRDYTWPGGVTIEVRARTVRFRLTARDSRSS